MTRTFRITCTLRSSAQIVESIRAFNIHGATRLAATWASKLKVPENEYIKALTVEPL